MEDHRERALDLLYAATKRFSMEFYIRPFLNRWPKETLARLARWADDENYHVRRLVSEGTRPKLPWAGKITIDPLNPLPFLDKLHADPTRYVTRSVANHLNDIAKFAPKVVVDRLSVWSVRRLQNTKEMDWITRHALRTLIKQGDQDALTLLGYSADIEISADLRVLSSPVCIGEALEFSCELRTETPQNTLVDYILHFHRPGGRAGRKVFKLTQGRTNDDGTLALKKKHVLKGNASTFKLHPGPHRIEIQVNGRIVASAPFELLAQ